MHVPRWKGQWLDATQKSTEPATELPTASTEVPTRVDPSAGNSCRHAEGFQGQTWQRPIPVSGSRRRHVVKDPSGKIPGCSPEANAPRPWPVRGDIAPGFAAVA